MPGMLERLEQLSAVRPWRTLGILLAFIVVAGVIGGPVAGRLSAGDGFVPASSESSRADAQLERATGEAPSPGIVLLVDGRATPAQSAAQRLAAVPGVAHADPGPSSTSTCSGPCERARPGSC